MSFNDKMKNIVGAIPGQSMTDKMGDHAYNRPAISSRPEEGVQIIFDSLTGPEGSRNVINALRNGATVDVIAQSIAKMMHGEGLMAPQAIPLMGPAIVAIIENVAEIAGVEAPRTEEEDPWSQPDPERVAQLVAEMDDAIAGIVEEELEDQAGEEAPLAPEGGVMAPPSGGLMSRPGGNT